MQLRRRILSDTLLFMEDQPCTPTLIREMLEDCMYRASQATRKAPHYAHSDVQHDVWKMIGAHASDSATRHIQCPC